MDVRLSRIDIIAVGSLSSGPRALADDYLKRMRPYCKVEVHEIKGVPLRDGVDRSSERESDRIIDKLDKLDVRSPEGKIVLCDSTGDQWTSPRLANELLGARRIVLIIGGAGGVNERVRSKAHMTISFGRITLPHELARVILAEQLYRSFRIARNEPYHY